MAVRGICKQDCVHVGCVASRGDHALDKMPVHGNHEKHVAAVRPGDHRSMFRSRQKTVNARSQSRRRHLGASVTRPRDEAFLPRVNLVSNTSSSTVDGTG